MARFINPLRYPGGKRTLTNYIDSLLLANNLKGCTFFEPYAGSAAVGLELLMRGNIGSLIICEKDIMIFSFWKSVFYYTEELCQKIYSTPITIQTWDSLKPLRDQQSLNPSLTVEIGFAGLFFNRTNFSGILSANPIGGINQTSKYPIDCRFNKARIINLIQDISKYKDNIEVHNDDAIIFMKSCEHRFFRDQCFAYFDPPYYHNGPRLYRHFYTDNDHIKLSKYVKGVRNLDWIISYDDAPFICALYSNAKAEYRPFSLDYSCAPKVRTSGRELLISNLPLPPLDIPKAIAMG